MITMIMIIERSCSYHDNQKNNTVRTKPKLTTRSMKNALKPFTLSLCATVFTFLLSEGREKTSLKSNFSLQQRNVRLNPNQKYFRDVINYCIWFVINDQSLPLNCSRFDVENGAMKTPPSIWLPYQVIWLAAEYGK